MIFESDGVKVTFYSLLRRFLYGVIAPCHFHELEVNEDRYLLVLNSYLLRMLRKLPNNMNVQQDWAPLNNTHAVRHLFETGPTNSCSGRGVPTKWPPCSPHLTLCEFLRCRCVKNKDYRAWHAKFPQLNRGFPSVTPSTFDKILQNVWGNLKERLNSVIREIGYILKLHNIGRNFTSWKL